MQQQKGVALIVFLIVIVLVGVSVFIRGISPVQLQLERDQQLDRTLRDAKQSLLDIAVNYTIYPGGVVWADRRGPGYLLCPDLDNDGISDIAIPGGSCVDTLGRLPYKSMREGEFRDSGNEMLWYAVSTNFDTTAVGGGKKVNTDVSGQITTRDNDATILSDGTAWDAVAAVIIAPGAPLVREDGHEQSRIQGVDDLNDPINYLDVALGEDNATFASGTLDGFIQGDVIDAGELLVNDRYITITYEEVMDRAQEKVAREMAAMLDEYYAECGQYPDATDFDPDPARVSYDSVANSDVGTVPVDTALPWNWGDACPGGTAPTWPVELSWLLNEGWHHMMYYERCMPAGTACISIDGTANAAEAVLVLAKRQLPGQNRLANTSTVLADYYEGDNNTVDSSYVTNQPEDHVFILR